MTISVRGGMALRPFRGICKAIIADFPAGFNQAGSCRHSSAALGAWFAHWAKIQGIEKAAPATLPIPCFCTWDGALLRVFFKPIGDLREAAEAVLGFPGAGKLMVFAMEKTQPGRHAVIHQGGVHLQPFGKRAAVVRIGMDEQGGRLGPGGIAQGGMGPELLRRLQGIAGVLIAGKAEADIRHAVEAQPVGNGALGGRRSCHR